MGTGGGEEGGGAGGGAATGDENLTTPEILGMQEDPKSRPRTLGGVLKRSKTLGRRERDTAADVSGAGFGFAVGRSEGVRGFEELMGGGGGGGGGSLVKSGEGEEGGAKGGEGGGGGLLSCAWFQTPRPANKLEQMGGNEDEGFVEFLREMWRTKGRVMLPYLTQRSNLN
jgi:hypothetical protein